MICPSNPFISIDPILALPGMRAALAACRAPVVAVSPIIGGRAVKGPTAKMMAELGLAGQRRRRSPVTTRACSTASSSTTPMRARRRRSGLPWLATRTLMTSENDKRRLAAEVLAFARQRF